MDEEIGLEQLGGHRTGIDGDECASGARRMRVDGPRDQLLAGAALALDEDGGLGRSRQPDELEDLSHPLGLADDAAESEAAGELLFEAAVLFRQAARLRALLDGQEHLFVLERLGDVVERAEPHRFDRALDGGVGGHDDDDRVRVPPADFGEHLEPGPVRKHEVEENDVVRLRLEGGEGARAVGRGGDLPSFPLQERGEDVPDHLFVIDDQNAQRSRHDTLLDIGSVTHASTPPPARGERPISPPWRRTISREMARPRPVPPVFLVV